MSLKRFFSLESRRQEQRGQALAVMVIGISVFVIASGMVLDGGNAMTQQRAVQNGADSAALAGAVVIIEQRGGAARDDDDVLDAITEAFADNGGQLASASYVDFARTAVGTVGQGGSIPASAWGVHATGTHTFSTLLAGFAGITTMTAGAEATALGGALRGVCSASDGCGVMPVTFSIPITTCDGTNRPLRVGIEWPLVGLSTALNDSSGRYMSTVPLCTTGPGGVGWLEMGCGGNLRDQINTPCNGPFDIPTWIQTSTGNVNAVEDAINAYRGQAILVPMFDATCRDVPSTGLPADCLDPGQGNNLYYHIPRFAYFLLHRAYIQGGNTAACNSAPGQPLVGGNGSTSCVKGWFVRYVFKGPVGAYDPCNGTDPACLEEPTLGVQLVR
jgi:hypothetical protein